MSVRDIAIAVLVMLIWGLNFAFAKAGLAELPPILMMTMRFTLVAAIVVPFVRRPNAPMGRVIALSFTLGFVHFSLLFTGLKGLDAAVAAIVIQLQVPFAVILAAFVLGDRPGWRRILGMVMAFSGVVIIFAHADVSGHLMPLALMLAAAMVWSIANFQIKALAGVDGLALNGWMALFAAPQLLLASIVFEHGQVEALQHATWRGFGAVVFMAVFATIVGYGLWYYLIRKYPMSLAMPFTLLGPVFGVAAGVVLLHEGLTLRMIAGSLVTITGVAVIVLRQPRAAAPPALAAPPETPAAETQAAKGALQ
ncbi:MAG: EamA family transporter [Alphaproteobacteria bacterium]